MIASDSFLGLVNVCFHMISYKAWHIKLVLEWTQKFRTTNLPNFSKIELWTLRTLHHIFKPNFELMNLPKTELKPHTLLSY